MLLLTCIYTSTNNQSKLWLQVEACDHNDCEEVDEDPSDCGRCRVVNTYTM